MKKATPKQIGGKRKGAGRPATGREPTRTLRMSDEFMAKVDVWAAQQPDEPLRSEAIRRLLELGLTAGTNASPSQRSSAARADRANELAAKTIERIIDPAAPTEERIARKRRLTKGPAEFRDARLDQPKSKK
jgi:hypothetical protein